MNQLFYNVAVELCIKSDVKNGQQYQKWLFAVSEILRKLKRNWCYLSSSFIFHNFKTEKFKLTFEGWNRPACDLFGFTRVSFCQICCISPSDSEANRDGADAESPFPLFFSFLLHLRTLAQEKRSGNFFSFWDWWAESLLVSIIVAKENIFSRSNNGRLQKEQLSSLAIAITAEIHARSLANFYCQYADRHMNLKFTRRLSEREPAILQFVIVKRQIDASF